MAWKGYFLEFLHTPEPHIYFGYTFEDDVRKAVEDLLALARNKDPKVPNKFVEFCAYNAEQDKLIYQVVEYTDIDEVDPEAWVDKLIRSYTVLGATNQCINSDHILRTIRRKRSALTVNAGLYYELWHGLQPVMTDNQWDTLAKELVSLQTRYAFLLPCVNFFDDHFNDFTDDTGMLLPYRDDYFVSILEQLRRDPTMPKV
ncbi:DNA ligase, adenylation domain [Erwinia phage AH06]|nr:DNA ligase, adenylation domain [Erwinia phage AH06]